MTCLAGPSGTYVVHLNYFMPLLLSWWNCLFARSCVTCTKTTQSSTNLTVAWMAKVMLLQLALTTTCSVFVALGMEQTWLWKPLGTQCGNDCRHLPPRCVTSEEPSNKIKACSDVISSL
jgi:hypothetical protein